MTTMTEAAGSRAMYASLVTLIAILTLGTAFQSTIPSKTRKWGPLGFVRGRNRQMNRVGAWRTAFCSRQGYPFKLVNDPAVRWDSIRSKVYLSASSSSISNTKEGSSGFRDWHHVSQIAQVAARHAGSIMKQTTGRIEVASTKANIKDLVTDSDVACQQVIQQTVESVFPNDVFLGEEDIASGREASMEALQVALDSSKGTDDVLIWVVDPIDGTTNYQAGLPLFGASIGVVARNPKTNEPEIVVGVIYNPVLEEMVSAIKGQGVFLNGNRLNATTSDIASSPLDQSLVNVGFPVTQKSTLLASSRAVAALSTRVRGLRMIASAAQVLSWIAQNKVQCYISWNLNAWDIAAGMLIVQESGGHLLNFDGTEANITSRDMIMTSAAGGKQLAEEILEILGDNDCLEYDVVS